MKKTAISKKSATDWKKVKAMKDSDVDLSDIPEIAPRIFARAVARRGLKERTRKVQLTVRLDSDVLEWFRSRGPGYQTRIGSLLREYMEAHRQPGR